MRIHGKMKFKRTLLLPHTFPSEMGLKKRDSKNHAVFNRNQTNKLYRFDVEACPKT